MREAVTRLCVVGAEITTWSGDKYNRSLDGLPISERGLMDEHPLDGTWVIKGITILM